MEAESLKVEMTNEDYYERKVSQDLISEKTDKESPV